MTDNWLPTVSVMLQQRYADRWRAYRATTPYPLPKRRTRKKPAPGVIDLAVEDEG